MVDEIEVQVNEQLSENQITSDMIVLRGRMELLEQDRQVWDFF